jgi:hypothetical protein
MVAESSMKPFTNYSGFKPRDNILHIGLPNRTDINTTPSSEDKLQRSLRKSHLTNHSSQDHLDLRNNLHVPNMQAAQASFKSMNPLTTIMAASLQKQTAI